MNLKTKLILFLSLVGFLYTCTKEEFEGPSIDNLYGNFQIIEPLTLTNYSPSFAGNEQVGFHCALNKPVEWKIAIQGLNTNATREITGFSKAEVVAPEVSFAKDTNRPPPTPKLAGVFS